MTREHPERLGHSKRDRPLPGDGGEGQDGAGSMAGYANLHASRSRPARSHGPSNNGSR
jgi:hypothetical protein